MEVKELDRIVIAKPVASRPTCSGLRSFSELLAGVINASPSAANGCSKMAVAAIRPKTVRLKPAMDRTSVCKFSLCQAGAAACSHDSVADLKFQSTTVFKPLAKVASRHTVSLFTSMQGNSRINQQQLVQVDALAQHLSKHKPHVDSNAYPPNPPQVELSQSVDAPKTEQRMLNEEPKLMASSSISSDQPSYDGYNWRKYGQKQVKGSEYPRSYYKCTYPNCPVKKKVERSVDWKIAEIVYKGEHSHPKPEPPKCSSSGVQERGLAIGGTGHDGDSSDPKFCDNTCASIEGLDGRTENQNTAWFSNRSTPGKSSLLCHDPAEMGKHNARVGTLESSAGQLRGNNEEGNKRVGYHDDKPKSKRRKDGNQNNEAGTAGEGVLEPRISVQNDTEPEITGDGFHWRKYGQKVVKGNPYPRSYYRCTSVKCNVRKHVERALNDPRAFITKYEGRHNHEMPMKDANKPATPETDSQKPTAKRNSK